jgi:hypothetical protein
MRLAMEQVEVLQYKLRMMGIPVDGPVNVYCDNEPVLRNVLLQSLCSRRSTILLHITKLVMHRILVRLAWHGLVVWKS